MTEKRQGSYSHRLVLNFPFDRKQYRLSVVSRRPLRAVTGLTLNSVRIDGLEYSEPNSISEFGWRGNGLFTVAEGAAEGIEKTDLRSVADDPDALANLSRVRIDLSRSSSLYQNGLTEIRVNALFGLNLIRAF